MSILGAAHDRWLGDEASRLLSFAQRSLIPGRGFGWLDDAGEVMTRQGLPVWITARMTHVFALAHLGGHAGAARAVDAGVRALTGPFADETNGGWFAQLDATGTPHPGQQRKSAYDHAFVLLAASSAHAAQRPGAEDLLTGSLELLLRRFWDPEHQMLLDEWDETFTRCDPYRGLNANMHGVEALMAAADVLDDPRLRARALCIVTRVVRDTAPAHRWRLPEHFDADWRPDVDYHRDRPADPFRPYGATVGHGLEWSRLTVQLAASLDAAGMPAPDWMLIGAESLFATAVADGFLTEDRQGRAPGFCYTTDWSGVPVVSQRMHWVLAEAISAAAVLHATTGDPAYARWYEQWWDLAAEFFIDREGGSWWHELDSRNRPDPQTWQGKPDVYHALQATLVPRLPVSPSLATALRDGAAPAGCGGQ